MSCSPPRPNAVVSRRQFLSMVGITTTATMLPAALDFAGSDADAAKRAKTKARTKKNAAAVAEGPLVAGRAVAALAFVAADRVILMPEGRTAAELGERSRWLAEACAQNGFRFSTRLHILIWGDERGV